MDQLVGQGQYVEQCVQMSGRRMQVHRFNRVATGKVNAVEALGQLEKVLVVLAVADPAPTIQV